MKLQLTVIALAACIATAGFAQDTSPTKEGRKNRPNAEGRTKGKDRAKKQEGEMTAGQDRPAGREGRPAGGDAAQMPMMRLQAALKLSDLTPEQKTQIESLMATVRPKAEALREEMKAARENMQAGTTPDPEARKAAREAMISKVKPLNDEIVSGLKAILTPEQMATVQVAGPMARNRAADTPTALPGNMPAMDAPTTGTTTPASSSAATSATTGTQEVSPFATAP